jgi:hypothetical protein
MLEQHRIASRPRTRCDADAARAEYEQAEEMNQRVLAGREKVLGVDHPDTLTSVSYLASVLRDQGKYEQAEAMNRRALTAREKVLGWIILSYHIIS